MMFSLEVLLFFILTYASAAIHKTICSCVMAYVTAEAIHDHNLKFISSLMANRHENFPDRFVSLPGTGEM